MPEDASEDMRTLWAIATDDIRFFKSQQYSVTNYALALYAAIFAFRSQVEPKPDHGLLFCVGLSLASIVVCLIGWQQLNALQKALTKSRAYADGALDNLSVEIRKLVASIRPPRTGGRLPPGDVVWALQALLVAGAVLTIAFVSIHRK